MCGLFGIVQPNTVPVDADVLQAAMQVQAHRGPDGRGMRQYAVASNTLLLAHQRLSIIDLSAAGLQPMEYRGGAGSLVYNGELYNYLELRSELAALGEEFTSQTDSEVLLAALHRWGPTVALGRFNWMGAFAWFDRERARLVLACDAGSEKPLYFHAGGARFVFASEVKTVLTLAQRRFALDRDTLGQFIFQGLSDASTRTLFVGVERLEPGCFVELDLRRSDHQPRPVRYEPPRHSADPTRMSLADFTQELRATFVDAVRLRLRSDVPVGVLLSGGIDSSAIAAVAQAVNGHQDAPRLLSAVSDDPRFDETRHIAAMERHLRQSAQKITLRSAPEKLVEDLSRLNWINDAPVAGLSTLGHYRLMERARELGLTVILSGQGADEILLGYRKFLGFHLQSLLRSGRVLRAAAVVAAFAANRSMLFDLDFSDAKRYVPLLRWITRWRNGNEPEQAIAGEWLQGWRSLAIGLGEGTLADRQRLDLRHFSVPSLCHYEDRMSMAMSREIRLPFLDSRLVDLLLRAPDAFKLGRGWTKYAFRLAMQDYLPPEICWRRDKRGFENPEGEWLKHELNAAVRDAFSPDSMLARRGIIDSAAMLARYERYCRQPVRGGSIWYREIFAPFTLELWMRKYEPWIA